MKTSSKFTAANIAAFVVGLVAIIGALVLTGLHDTVPGYVWAVAVAGVTAGAGLSLPAGGAPTATLNDLALVLPQLIAGLNNAVPGAVKVEDVAAEILRQVAAAAATSSTSTPATASTPASTLPTPATVTP